jgi:hypothetical protein
MILKFVTFKLVISEKQTEDPPQIHFLCHFALAKRCGEEKY